jgi:hypothetical protein
MQFPLELEVQVIASASSGYTPELIDKRLALLAGRADEQARQEQQFLLELKRKSDRA